MDLETKWRVEQNLIWLAKKQTIVSICKIIVRS